MTANDITELLYKRHSEDIAIEQCQCSSTVYQHGQSNYGIMDFWAMTRSWANRMISGYEIKVSRQDFIHDNKWPQYLDACNCFYFVVPYGLIDIKEVPEQAGLIMASKTGSRLYIKKKAPFRDIEDPIEIFLRILMWKCKIIKNGDNIYCDKKSYWERWLKEKKIDYDFGYNVSKMIRKRLKEEVEKVKKENEKLKIENQACEKIKQLVSNLGFGEDIYADFRYNGEKKFEKKLEEIKSGINQDLLKYVSDVINQMEVIKKILEK